MNGYDAMSRLLRIILDVIYHLVTPIVLLRLLIPSRFFTRRRYRAGMLERLGGVPTRRGDRPCLWIHAVSVGELRAAIPLIERLPETLPGWDFWVSTSTDTAREVADQTLPAHVPRSYYPLDYGWAVRRTLRRIRPTAVLLIELELWPNFLLAAEEAHIPVFVANGRISDRSFPHYRRLRPISRWLFDRVNAFAAQTEEYAWRFESLGVARDRIEVLGNLKYDGAPARDESASTLERLGWAAGDPPLILAGGCTHPGEEDVLLEIWSDLRRTRSDLKLILAPRHIERAGEVEALAAARSGGPVLRWSRLRDGAGPPDPGAQHRGSPVVVVDVVGDLDRFYRLADLVFVGGSLTPRGGHNLLEPARLGKPILFGPSVANFEEIARHLLAERAALQIPDRGALRKEAERLLGDSSARRLLGDRAREAAGKLGGATARHLDWIARRIAHAMARPAAAGLR